MSMPESCDDQSNEVQKPVRPTGIYASDIDQKYLRQQKSMSVLLLEDDPGDAHLVQLMLAEASLPRNGNLRTELVHEAYLRDGLVRLSEMDFDIILLDQSLPDSPDDGTLKQVRQHSPDIPVILLTGLDDELSALAAVRAGAQDYLVKGKFNADTLARAIRYGIERHRLWLKLEESERFFRTLIQENADSLILVVHKTKEIIYINPAAEALLGAQPDELLGSVLELPIHNDQVTVFELDRKHEALTLLVELRTVQTVWQGQSVNVVSLRDITKD